MRQANANNVITNVRTSRSAALGSRPAPLGSVLAVPGPGADHCLVVRTWEVKEHVSVPES